MLPMTAIPDTVEPPDHPLHALTTFELRASDRIAGNAACLRALWLSLGGGSGGQLCEVGSGSPVDLRHGVGVVAQGCCSAPAVAEARRGVA
jgi:hypothetical protein